MTQAIMGTIVTIDVVRPSPEATAAIERAFGWFHEIEERCTRFDERSELRQLMARPGEIVEVSSILFETLRFAIMVARESGGAFDPAAGNWREIELVPERNAITLRKPLTLDLGAVAKGLAVDTAARELAPFRDFAIDAGGDLYLGGTNPTGAAWSVGIRHPRREREMIETVQVSNQAVCTSGDYERGAHILDPRTGTESAGVASATVVAPGAMLADALATAAFVLGPKDGIAFLRRMGVEGLIVTSNLERHQTRGLKHAA
ncbi:MAG: FAD:protein FMN transferase [Terriglobia bacterium]